MITIRGIHLIQVIHIGRYLQQLVAQFLQLKVFVC